MNSNNSKKEDNPPHTHKHIHTHKPTERERDKIESLYRVSHDLLVGSHDLLVRSHDFLVISHNFLVARASIANCPETTSRFGGLLSCGPFRYERAIAPHAGGMINGAFPRERRVVASFLACTFTGPFWKRLTIQWQKMERNALPTVYANTRNCLRGGGGYSETNGMQLVIIAIRAMVKVDRHRRRSLGGMSIRRK